MAPAKASLASSAAPRTTTSSPHAPPIAATSSPAFGGVPDGGRGDDAQSHGRPARGPGRPGPPRPRRPRRSAPGRSGRRRRVRGRSGVGLLVVDVVQARPTRLGHQEPGGVRTDVDAGVPHAPGTGGARHPVRGRGDALRGDLGMIARVTSDAAIEVRGLRKRYGDVEAVRGIDFTVRRGEVFGLLGPNGAGQDDDGRDPRGLPRAQRGRGRRCSATTRRRARAGAARARGHRAPELRHLPPRHASARRSSHWAGFYPHPRDVGEVIELAGLGEKADARTRQLSGGQLRRLDFALALVGDPELIFLDEPTTGFDPAARRAAWETIRSLRGLGKTVLLDHALPRRGPGARRPGGDRQGRRDLAEGAAARARRGRRRRATASPTATATASSIEQRDRRPDDRCCTS